MIFIVYEPRNLKFIKKFELKQLIYSVCKFFLSFLFMLADFSCKFFTSDVSHLIIAPYHAMSLRPSPPLSLFLFLHCTRATFTRENMINYDRSSTNRQEYDNHAALCTTHPTLIARNTQFATSRQKCNVKKSTIRILDARGDWKIEYNGNKS